MSIELDVQALTDRFLTEWDSKHSDIPRLLENMRSKKPDTGTFVRFIVDPNEVFHRAGGKDNPVIERTGQVTVQICVPAETGNLQAWQLADSCRAMFHFWMSEDEKMRCGSTRIDRRPPIENDPYFIVTVSTNYQSIRRT
ncbi:phage tail terminator-like protein [Qipengyuania sp. NPDC077410]|uniref:phage tail terminator-like protein n=1 Tax=Qipengyuania sp. NPDC077410 TaxID=3364496 RepID=UPI0037CB5E30